MNPGHPETSDYTQRLSDLAFSLPYPAVGVMDPDDMRTWLAWLVWHAPQMVEFALVRDLAIVERLMTRLNEGQADDEEP